MVQGNHPVASRHPSTEGNFLNFFDQGKEFKQFPSAEGWQAKPDGVVASSREVFPCNLPCSHAPALE